MRFPKRRKTVKSDEEQPAIEETEEIVIPSPPVEEPIEIVTEQEEEPMSAALNIETATDDELVSAIEDVLDRLPIEHLVKVKMAADDRIRDKKDAAKIELLARFRAEAAEMGLSLFEVLPQQQKPTRRSQGPTKIQFRGPNGEEYSGRGVNPRWLQALVNEGHSKEDFRIRDDGMTKWEEERQQAA